MQRLLVFAGSIALVSGVRHGDEDFQMVADGQLLGFCNGDVANGIAPSIDFINTADGTLNHRLELDATQQANFGSWSDVVYMEQASFVEDEGRLVLANDRNGWIHVIDVKTRSINASIQMGARPVHAYAIPEYQEFWSHSDGNGTWDIVKIDASLSALEHADVVAHVTSPGHGKLLWDPHLLPYGYASNTAEGYVYEFDLSANPPVMTRQIEFSGQSASMQCTGTHGMAYSNINGHIYATCSGAGGLAEINPGPDPSTQSTWEIVQVFQGLEGEVGGGQVYESADERFLALINKGDNKVHIVEPQANGAQSTRMFPDIAVPGHPDKVAFFEHKTSTGTNSTRMFFSLTSPNTADGAGSGVGVIDTCQLDAESTREHQVLHVDAGNVAVGGYRTYRSILRAGNHIVVPTNYAPGTGGPAFSLINAETLAVTYAASNVGPSRMAWAPNVCAATPAATPTWGACPAAYTSEPTAAPSFSPSSEPTAAPSFSPTVAADDTATESPSDSGSNGSTANAILHALSLGLAVVIAVAIGL